MKPLVSICVASYNQAEFVWSTLDSIINQSYRPLEVVIVDDCSKDDSVKVIKQWLKNYNSREDPNNCEIQFYEKNVNSGICSTFNMALSKAKGKYIGIIGTDDILMINKLEEQVNIFEKSSLSIGVIYSDAYIITEHGERYFSKFIQWHRQFITIPQGFIFDNLIEGNFIPVMTALFRRECFDVCGMFDERLIYEDYDMFLRISKKFSFKYISYICAEYRIHNYNMHKKLADLKALETDFDIFYKHVGESIGIDGIINKKLLHFMDKMTSLKSSNIRNYLKLYNDYYSGNRTVYVALKYHIPYRWLLGFHNMVQLLRKYYS